MLQLVVNGDEHFDVESSGLEKCSTNSGLSTVLRWMVHRVHLNLSDFGGSFSAGYLLDQNLGISSYVHSTCHMKIGEYKNHPILLLPLEVKSCKVFFHPLDFPSLFFHDKWPLEV